MRKVLKSRAGTSRSCNILEALATFLLIQHATQPNLCIYMYTMPVLPCCHLRFQELPVQRMVRSPEMLQAGWNNGHRRRASAEALALDSYNNSVPRAASSGSHGNIPNSRRGVPAGGWDSTSQHSGSSAHTSPMATPPPKFYKRSPTSTEATTPRAQLSPALSREPLVALGEEEQQEEGEVFGRGYGGSTPGSTTSSREYFHSASMGSTRASSGLAARRELGRTMTSLDVRGRKVVLPEIPPTGRGAYYAPNAKVDNGLGPIPARSQPWKLSRKLTPE